MIQDRSHAGRLLADKLASLVKDEDCILLSIPRGGVVVGAEISRILEIPLDVIISKKITPPDYPEYAVGAVTSEGFLYKGPQWKNYAPDPRFNIEVQQKKDEVIRRIKAYRGNSSYELKNKTVILVDDGIATGSTVFAILEWLSTQETSQVILAVPVIPYSTYQFILQRFKVSVIALETPHEFSAVGQFYRKFDQVPEQTVLDLIQKFKKGELSNN